MGYSTGEVAGPPEVEYAAAGDCETAETGECHDSKRQLGNINAGWMAHGAVQEMC